jgi:hypothetical protein
MTACDCPEPPDLEAVVHVGLLMLTAGLLMLTPEISYICHISHLHHYQQHNMVSNAHMCTCIACVSTACAGLPQAGSCSPP